MCHAEFIVGDETHFRQSLSSLQAHLASEREMNYKKTDSQMLKWLSLCRPSMLLPRLPDQCRSSSHSHFKFPVCNLCKALGTKRMMQGFSIEQKKPWEKNPTPAVMTSIQMNVLGKTFV